MTKWQRILNFINYQFKIIKIIKIQMLKGNQKAKNSRKFIYVYCNPKVKLSWKL